MEKLTQNLTQELKRGVMVLCVLASLDEEKYGYSLVQDMESDGFQIEQSTLYPLLRRLESQGLLVSDWSVEETRPRKYYRITEDGIRLRSLLIGQWRQMAGSMERILERVEPDETQ